MVPENEFHHKEQPTRSATPANQQNGPGSTGKIATSTSKADEGMSEDGGEFNKASLGTCFSFLCLFYRIASTDFLVLMSVVLIILLLMFRSWSFFSFRSDKR